MTLKPSSSQEYQLELIVRADSWANAIKALEKAGINEKRELTKRAVSGYYVVGITKKYIELTDTFYENIRVSDVAIIRDQLSKEREQTVLGAAYDAETELRKLLLHIIDLIEPFLDILAGNMKHKNSKFTPSDSILSSEFHDPITANLSFGELLSLLQYDLSTYWMGKKLDMQSLDEILAKTNNFDEFRREIAGRQKHITIWDIINDNVLEVKCELSHIASQISKLVILRDKAAHHNLMTAKDVKDAQDFSRHIINTITKRRQLNIAEQKHLETASRTYASNISRALGSLQTQTLAQALESIVEHNSVSLSDVLRSKMSALAAIESLRRPTIAQALASAQPLTISLDTLRGIDGISEAYNKTKPEGKE